MGVHQNSTKIKFCSNYVLCIQLYTIDTLYCLLER